MQKRQYTILIVIIIIALASVVLVFYFKGENTKFMSSVFSSIQTNPEVLQEIPPDVPAVDSVPELKETYNDVENEFSFKFPEGYATSSFPADNGGRTLVVQKPNENIGFQIVITPFDEPDSSISKERIIKEIPDMEVLEPQEVAVGGGKDGLAFVSKNPFFGVSREVWFMFKGNLYQLSTYLSQEKLLQAILETWKFN